MCKKLPVISPRDCSWTGDVFVQFLFLPVKEQHRLRLSKGREVVSLPLWLTYSLAGAILNLVRAAVEGRGPPDFRNFVNCVWCSDLHGGVGTCCKRPGSTSYFLSPQEAMKLNEKTGFLFSLTEIFVSAWIWFGVGK